MLAMNLVAAKVREQNVAHHDCFLARGRPARQTEQRAPITLMHDAVADEIVILAVIKDWHAYHTRVLNCAPHQLVVLNAMTIVCNRDHACLREGSDRAQFFA